MTIAGTTTTGADLIASAVEATSIAVYGASDTSQGFARRPIEMLQRHGFTGDIIPVNPKRDTVFDLPCVPSLAASGRTADLAIITVRAERVRDVLEDCASGGVPVAFVLSAGYAEAGQDGPQAEADLVRTARDVGVRLVGPNCLGFVNVTSGIYGYAGVYDVIDPGPVVLVTQSGTVGSLVIDRLHADGFGVDLWMTTGNEADLGMVDMLGAIRRRPRELVALYIESLKAPDAVLEEIRLLVADGRPVVVLKSGTSTIGQRATASHTGALAGADAYYDLLFQAAGAIRVTTMEEMSDCISILGTKMRPHGKAVVVTGSGGFGAMFADQAHTLAVPMARISADGERKMRELVPFCATRNPIDPTTAAGDRGVLGEFMQIIGDEPDVGYIVYTTAHSFSPLMRGARERVDEFAEFGTTCAKPLIIASELPTDWRKVMRSAGVAVVPDGDRAVRALACLVRADGQQVDGDGEPTTDRPVVPTWVDLLDEVEATALLAEAGLDMIATVAVTTRDDARAAAADCGYPVVLKVLEGTRGHKSDLGGVVVGLADTAELDEAWAWVGQGRPTLACAIQPMFAGALAELLVGGIVDERFGPHVMVATGGIFAEVLADRQLARAPVARPEALRMLRALRSYPLLTGARGRPRADLDAVARFVVTMSELIAGRADDLSEVEVNPVMVSADRAVGVDALVVRRSAAPSTPRHEEPE